ncbi:hypothetical protein CHU92_04700 [Flavobacterium cyanobacteriorum]|uniref:Uncharacterized protein n=1 Tax=Flavobacterium cyanobacteriorum TaxID=2022802 RepID=A0A255ZF84_9FLAO|nr:hypothetical protein CHU92_04700 [Flavobacterium cyanobacteriorum]
MPYKKRESRYQIQKSPIQRFLFVLGIVFFLMYLVLGCMVIFWKQLPIPLSSGRRLALGIVLIVYAFFRFVRLIQNYRS